MSETLPAGTILEVTDEQAKRGEPHIAECDGGIYNLPPNNGTEVFLGDRRIIIHKPGEFVRVTPTQSDGECAERVIITVDDQRFHHRGVQPPVATIIAAHTASRVERAVQMVTTAMGAENDALRARIEEAEGLLRDCICYCPEGRCTDCDRKRTYLAKHTTEHGEGKRTEDGHVA